MAPDLPIPDPPDLSNRGKPREFDWEDETLGSEDFAREDLETLLQAGAWAEAYVEWTEDADLDDEQVRIVTELGLFQAFDFYRDPTDGRLRVDAPSMPTDWRDRDVTAALDSSSVSMIDVALQDLGRTVRETLEDEIDRTDAGDDSDWGPDDYGTRDE